MLLDTFRSLWTELTAINEPRVNAHQLEMAAAALMLEVSAADFEETGEEQRTLLGLLKTTFNLQDDEVLTLERHARGELDKASSFHEFVRTVNELASYEQKLVLIEALWKVAYADGDLDKYEEHLIRRVAHLIYLPHEAFIRAKLSAHATHCD